MSSSRNIHQSIVLADGRVLILGGVDGRDRAIASAEVYDPKAGTFAQTGSMRLPREGATVTLLGDGSVLVAGGEGDEGAPYASAEIYDPALGAFRDASGDR
jgi:hypothetical protein